MSPHGIRLPAVHALTFAARERSLPLHYGHGYSEQSSSARWTVGGAEKSICSWCKSQSFS